MSLLFMKKNFLKIVLSIMMAATIVTCLKPAIDGCLAKIMNNEDSIYVYVENYVNHGGGNFGLPI